jgi:hypothetical protein
MVLPTKACSVCDADLNGQKRVKDAEGNYFCPACWQARLDVQRSTSTAAPISAVSKPAAPPSQPLAHARPSAAVKAPDVLKNTPPENVLLQKLGFLAVGLAAVAIFDLWPFTRPARIPITFGFP